MVAFYVFEGSFFQGGGGWEHLEVCTDLDDARATAESYLHEGHWTFSPRSETFAITAHTEGTVHTGQNLYPHTRLDVPGLTPVTFDAKANPIGGAPEPGGRFDQYRVDSMWDSVNILNTLVEDSFRGLTVSIDWAAVELPVLAGPPLPDDAELFLDLDSGGHVVIEPDRLGDNDYVAELVAAITALDPSTAEAAEEFLAALPDLDDVDEIGDGLTDVLVEADTCRHLTPGYNSLFE